MVIRLLRSALIGVLLSTLCVSVQAAPASATISVTQDSLPQHVLADFDQAQIARAQLRAQLKIWECPPVKQGKASTLRVETVSAKRAGQNESALRLSYRLQPSAAASTEALPVSRFAGIDLTLPKLRIADYDHLRLWLRLDGKPAPKLRVRFNHASSLDAVATARTGEGFNVIGLDSGWKQVLIPLNALSGVIDGVEPESLSLVISSPDQSTLQGALEVDDIELVRIGQRVGAHEDRAVAAQKKAWEMQRGGEVAARRAIRARAIELPPGPLVRRDPMPEDDQEFIQQVLRDTWRGLDGLRDRENGLPFDTVTFFPGGGAPAVGDYTNVTNIGLFMMSVIAARELGLVDAKGASQRLQQIVTTLEKLETWHGFFFNYYDTTSLERTSHFISFVDSAWLSAGLMTTRMAEPSLKPRIDRLLKKQNYAFFYDAGIGQMAHGFHVQRDARSNNRYGLLYSEPRLGSLIAIGRGDVPESHWFSLSRTFPTDWTWQSMSPLNRTPRLVDGYKVTGGYYLWQGLRYLPSWGGSMFEALMPALALDDQTYAPHSLGANAIAHVDIQRRYAQEVLNLPVWGMSPSANPLGGYGEYGISILGVKGYDESVVTPHASGLAAMLRPREAVLNLREMAQLYPIYGNFGFYDAVEPKSGKVAYKYLALDQSMLFLGLANTVKPHLVQRYFAADPDIRRALPVVRSENFFK